MADDPPVFREGVGVNEDVVHVAYYLAIVDELAEYVIHHSLECHRGVAQSEEHDGWFEQASISLECSFPLVTLLNLHIVEPPVEVKHSEELGIAEAGQDVRVKGEGVGVFDCDLVQLPIILYEAE